MSTSVCNSAFHAAPTGSEASGIVMDCGKGVTRFKHGDKVHALRSQHSLFQQRFQLKYP